MPRHPQLSQCVSSRLPHGCATSPGSRSVFTLATIVGIWHLATTSSAVFVVATRNSTCFVAAGAPASGRAARTSPIRGERVLHQLPPRNRHGAMRIDLRLHVVDEISRFLRFLDRQLLVLRPAQSLRADRRFLLRAALAFRALRRASSPSCAVDRGWAAWHASGTPPA